MIALARKVVGLASTADGRGYWEVAADGGLFAFGDAGFYGSMGGRPITKPVVGMAPTHDGRGYWEVASDGGIFAFGDAPYLGSMGGTALVPSGGGHGQDARRRAATGSPRRTAASSPSATPPSAARPAAVALQAPIVSMTPSSTAGYWLAASDGGIFSFGVPFHGLDGLSRTGRARPRASAQPRAHDAPVSRSWPRQPGSSLTGQKSPVSVSWT